MYVNGILTYVYLSLPRWGNWTSRLWRKWGTL